MSGRRYCYAFQTKAPAGVIRPGFFAGFRLDSRAFFRFMSSTQGLSGLSWPRESRSWGPFVDGISTDSVKILIIKQYGLFRLEGRWNQQSILSIIEASMQLGQDVADSLTPEQFVWLLGSLCQVHRVPFSPAIVLHQYPSGHTRALLIEALPRPSAWVYPACGPTNGAAEIRPGSLI